MQKQNNTARKRRESSRTKESTPASTSSLPGTCPTSYKHLDLYSDPLWQKVLQYPGSKEAVETLQRAEIPAEVIWVFLVLVDFSYTDDTLKHDLPNPEDLRSLAGRAERLGTEIHALSRNTLISPPPDVYGHVFAWLPGILGAYSGYLQLQAYRFGELGKTKPSSWKFTVIAFLEYVKKSTGREHYTQIACLLEAVAGLHGAADVTNSKALKVMLNGHRKTINKSPSAKSMPKGMRDAFERVSAQVALEKKGHKPFTLGKAIAAKFSNSLNER